MKRAVAVVALTFLPGGWAMAGDEGPSRRSSELADALRAMSAVIDSVARAEASGGGDFADAAPRLREMLRTGRAEESDVVLLTRWIFHEKEEKVARGLAEALRSADLSSAGREGARWNPVAAAMAGLLESSLSDAGARRRRRDTAQWPELEALVSAAAPAIAASLREADPATRDELARLAGAAAEALRRADRAGQERPER